MENSEAVTLTTPKRILVGLDGSDGSKRALEWAINLARTLEAEIVAVHVYEPAMPGLAGFYPVAAPVEWETEEARLFQDEWAAPLKTSGIRYRTLLEEGVPAPTLLATADAEHVDLIVTGNRGLGGFRELLLGSVSQQLVLYARAPVVIIPSERHRNEARVDAKAQSSRPEPAAVKS